MNMLKTVRRTFSLTILLASGCLSSQRDFSDSFSQNASATGILEKWCSVRRGEEITYASEGFNIRYVGQQELRLGDTDQFVYPMVFDVSGSNQVSRLSYLQGGMERPHYFVINSIKYSIMLHGKETNMKMVIWKGKEGLDNEIFYAEKLLPLIK